MTSATSNLRLPEARDLIACGFLDSKRLPLIEFIDAQQAEIERLDGLWRTEKARAYFNFEENERLRAALELARALPITTPELIRLRNAGQITFDKQVFHIIDCLLQQRECLAGETILK